MALAHAQEKQSEAFGSWLKLFTNTTPSAPQPDAEETELTYELERFKSLRQAGLDVQLPPEFALAYALKMGHDVNLE